MFISITYYWSSYSIWIYFYYITIIPTVGFYYLLLYILFILYLPFLFYRILFSTIFIKSLLTFRRFYMIFGLFIGYRLTFVAWLINFLDLYFSWLFLFMFFSINFMKSLMILAERALFIYSFIIFLMILRFFALFSYSWFSLWF